MSSFSRVTLLGNLGKDPECRDFSGDRVANFPLATSRRWTDKSGQKQEKTDWHRISVWGKQADLCAAYLQKGSKVLVDGRLETRSYVDKEGVQRTIVEIKAASVVFLDGRDKAANDNSSQPAKTLPNYDLVPDSDTPF